MNDGVVVRNYRPTDHDGVVDLWQRVFPDDPPHNEPRAVLAAKLAVDDLVIVAEHAGRIVAACMAGYDGHRGWLYAVAVDPDRRRGGLGRAVVEAALRRLRERSCIKVNLQIRATNTAVAAFYQSLGFEVEERLSMGRMIEDV